MKSNLKHWVECLILPGIRLSNQWSNTRKTIVGGLIVVTVLVAATGLYAHFLAMSIDATQRERATISRLRVHIGFWRDVILSRSSGSVADFSTGAVTQSNVEERVLAAFGADTSRPDGIRQLMAASKQLAQLDPRPTKERRFVTYTMLSRATLDQIEEDGRQSRMLGDPELDTVAIVLTREFPSLLENVAKQAAVAEIPNEDLRTYATGAQLIVLDSLARTRAGTAQLRALGVLDDALRARLEAFEANLKETDELANQRLYPGKTQIFVRKAMADVINGFDLLGGILDTVDSHLSKRIEAQNAIRWTTISLVVVLATGFAYMILGTVLSIRDSLRSLERGSRAFCSGKLDSRITVESQDEFHLVAINFNKIADEFNRLLNELREQSEKSQLQLQIKVAERTEELSRANRELSATIEALKAAEEELVRSEKMAALGGLVAGVAHEVNTPIGLSYMIVTHMQEQLGELAGKFGAGQLRTADFEKFLELADEDMRHATANLQKAVALIDSFKQVAVDQTSNVRRQFDLEFYLNEIVRSLNSPLRKGGHRVEIAVDGKIVCDSYPGALSQAATNIILNAVTHGFEGRTGGTIRITADMPDADHCRIVISDDGKGMPDEVSKRVFEPFFTTRRGRGGSGLGLNIAYNLVTQRLGGSIKCVSAEGRGSTFILMLPLSAKG